MKTGTNTSRAATSLFSEFLVNILPGLTACFPPVCCLFCDIDGWCHVSLASFPCVGHLAGIFPSSSDAPVFRAWVPLEETGQEKSSLFRRSSICTHGELAVSPPTTRSSAVLPSGLASALPRRATALPRSPAHGTHRTWCPTRAGVFRVVYVGVCNSSRHSSSGERSSARRSLPARFSGDQTTRACACVLWSGMRRSQTAVCLRAAHCSRPRAD